MNDFIAGLAVAVLLGLVGLAIAVSMNTSDKQRECEAKGGTLIKSHYEYKCVKLEQIK